MTSIHRRGDTGPAVERIIALLHQTGYLTVEPPTTFDHDVELAVRAFQQQRNLSVDGMVGPATYRRLDEARWRLGDRILNHRPGDPLAGDDVYTLQQRLLELGFHTGEVDGYFGPDTETGLREFQRNVGLPADGTCGPATLKALQRLAPLVRGGEPNALRDQERIRQQGPSLAGKTVVIDPRSCHRLPAPYRETGEEILHDIAGRVQGRLVVLGVAAYLTRSPVGRHRAAANPTDEEAADFANLANADLAISLGVEVSGQPASNGVASYFFGSDDHRAWSSPGERFAGLMQREIVARTDLIDLRHHGKAWEFLRRTRMPAVQVELGYLSNEGDADRLSDASFRDVVAEAIVVAVQRFYLTPDDDAETGVLRFSELRAALDEHP